MSDGSHQHGAAIQDFYPEDVAVCFGCGRLNEHGHHVRSFWDGEQATATFRPEPFHEAITGIVYGGLLASLLDCHTVGTGAAALYAAAGRPLGSAPAVRCVTGRLEVDFLAPTPLGPVLQLRAWPVEVGARKVVVEGELTADDVVTVRCRTIAVRLPDRS